MSAAVTIGFLHTAEVHVATFTDLVAELAPGARAVHVVDPTLLNDARRRGGVDGDLRARLLARIVEAGDGTDVVVCTCSTVSGAAEDLAHDPAVRAAAGPALVPVIRVDRPMAEAAVDLGPRIGVLATLESTLAPTVGLIESVAGARGVPLIVSVRVCERAWDRFEAGDTDGYLQVVARAIDGWCADGDVDVVVLAQASMAGAASGRVRSRPVLSSPRAAVLAAVRAAVRAAAGRADGDG